MCGAGIESHQEFVDLVVSKLGGLPKSDSVSQRENSDYQGGEVRTMNDNSTTHLSLVFQGTTFKSNDFYALKLAEIILGNSEFGRINALLHENRAVESGKAVQANFQDSGLFGVQFSVASDKANHGLETGVNALKHLTKVTPQELNIAKSLLTNSLLTAMDRSADRLEEAAKNVNIFGKVLLNDYVNQIDSVKVD